MQTNLDLFSLPATGLNQNIGTKPKAADESKADSFASWLKSYEAPSKAKKSAPNSASEVLNSSQSMAQSGLVGPEVQPESSPMKAAAQELGDEGQDSFSGGMDSQADSEAFDQAATETATSTSLGDASRQEAALATQTMPSAPPEQVSTSSSSSSHLAPTLSGSIETNASPESAPAPTLYGFVAPPTTEVTQEGQPVPTDAEAPSLTQDFGPVQPAASEAVQATDDRAAKVDAASVLNQQVATADELAAVRTPADKAATDKLLSSKQATNMTSEAAKGAADKKPLVAGDAGSKDVLSPQSPLASTEFDKAPSQDNMADSSESRPSFDKKPQTVAPTLNDAMAVQESDSVLATPANVSVSESAELSPGLTAASLSSTEAFKSDLFVTHSSQGSAGASATAADAAASMAAISQEGRVDPVAAASIAATESLRSMSPATPEFESIAEQLRMQMTPGMSRVSFIVDPPELGRVLIRLSMQRGRLVGEISAENREVAKTLESGLSALKVNLQESGVNVDSLRVQQDQFLGNGDGHFANQDRSHGAQGERNRSDGRTDRAEVRSDSARSKREQRATDNDGQVNLVA